MPMGYVLGVDGGNTKTDYLLYTVQGALVDRLRAGTCSHEALGMEGAHAEMDARIGELLTQAGIQKADIVAAAFGLAGIDQPFQKEALEGIVRAMGFSNSVAMNDSFLGIKAGSPAGIGVCSINGTGTASGGIDADGNWMQVGGMGPLTGDDAGGSYLAQRAVRAAYDAIFRFGEETSLTSRVLSIFGCQTGEALHTAISTEYLYGDAVRPLTLVEALLAASAEGDRVARDVVYHVADTLARGAAGCAARLRFDAATDIPVVLIGSVWTKGRHAPMIERFAERFEQYAARRPALHILSVPPAVGSVLWALELALGAVPSDALRARVLQAAGELV